MSGLNLTPVESFAPAPLRPVKPASKRKRRIVPEEKRKRIGVSCDRCRKRKLRCRAADESKPLSEHDTCTECLKAGSTCTRTLPRKKRVYGSIDVLSMHYQALMILVKKLFPDQDCETVPGLREIAKKNNIEIPEDILPEAVPESAFLAAKTTTAVAVDEKSTELIPKGPIYTTAEKKISPIIKIEAEAEQQQPYQQEHQQKTDFAVERKAQPDLGTERIIYDRVGVPYYVGSSGSMAFFDSLCKIIGKKNDGRNKVGRVAVKVSNEKHMSKEVSAEKNAALIARPDNKGVFFYTISASSFADSAMLSLPNVDQASFLPPKEECDQYVDSFMAKINPIFPFFRVKRFKKKYEEYWADIRGTAAQKSKWESRIDWRCCLYMVLVMGSRSMIVSKETSRKYGVMSKYASVVQGALSVLTVTTSLETVQALFLLSYYFYGINERNAAWLLAGITCRQAMAMGYHRQSSCNSCEPEDAQQIKQIWYSLYSFELALCANLGRPSCIRHDDIDVSIPDEFDEEFSQLCAPGSFIYTRKLLKYFNDVIVNMHMGEFKDLLTQTNIDFTLNFTRKLKDFLSTLPPHLVELSPSLSNNHARSILKIHMRTHYTISILSRPFVLYLAGADLNQLSAPKLRNLALILNLGCASAIAISQILTTMSRRNLVNGVYHTDIFYGYCACLVLSLISVTMSSGKFSKMKLAYSKETINSAIRSIVFVMDSMYLEGTNFRLARVTASILSGLGIDAHSSQPAAPAQPDTQNMDAPVKPSPTKSSSFGTKVYPKPDVAMPTPITPIKTTTAPAEASSEIFPQSLFEEYEKMFMPHDDNEFNRGMDEDFDNPQNPSHMFLEDVDLFTETFNTSFYDVTNTFNFQNIIFPPSQPSFPENKDVFDTVNGLNNNIPLPQTSPDNSSGSHDGSSGEGLIGPEFQSPAASSSSASQNLMMSDVDSVFPSTPSSVNNPTGGVSGSSGFTIGSQGYLDALYNHGDVGVISNMSWMQEDHGKSQLMDYVKQKSKTSKQ